MDAGLLHIAQGVAIYFGPVTVPLTNDTASDREVQIEHDDGQVSTVQYYLPAGVSLPLEEGFPYTFWFRNTAGIYGGALGVVITRPTASSGARPLMNTAKRKGAS